MDVQVGDILVMKKEHPCGSRFPDIIGESEAMLRLKASILKAAAHGRKKGGGERTGHQPRHALPPHGTARAVPRKAGVTRMREPIRGGRETPGRPEWR